MLDADTPDLAELEGIDAALAASLLRDSFRDFAEYFWPRMSGMPYPDNCATRALCAALQSVADGRIWRLLVAIAPGIGKSTMLALYSAWRLARRSDWRSLHAMAASADANRESLRVRRLVQHEDFLRLFPHVALALDEQAVQAWATTAGGRYYALGLDGAITSKRVLEAVVDDPMTAADRHSKKTRDEVWQWVDESLKSRLDGDRAPIVIVAQRLDRDDVHARCLASGEAWAMLEPAAERDGRGLELRDHAGELVWRDDRAPDELIAPQMLGREKLAGLSKSVRITQYQQRPDEDDGGASIPRTAWRFHAPKGANPSAPRPYGCATPEVSPTVITPDRFDAIVISIDPTFGGTKTSNDFASIQVWGARGRDRFLLERWKKRAKQREQREQVKAFRAKYRRAKIIIERAAGGDGMIEELEADGVKDIEGVTVGTNTGGKAARLDNVSPTIEQGFAYLPIGMTDLQDFVNELAGMTSHDDDMDACSQALHWLNVESGTTGTDGFKNVTRGLGCFLDAAIGQGALLRPGVHISRRPRPDPPEVAEAVAKVRAAYLELAARALPMIDARMATLEADLRRPGTLWADVGGQLDELRKARGSVVAHQTGRRTIDVGALAALQTVLERLGVPPSRCSPPRSSRPARALFA